MQVGKLRKVFIVPLLLLVVVTVFVFKTNNAVIDFSTQVKPIINKKCIFCHGGVKKEGGFSLLFREEALTKTKSGKFAIVPGDPGSSEMIRRLTLDDPEERMPYKHDALSKDEIKIFTQWVKQGAKWGEHWAYIPLSSVKIPAVKSDWIKDDIDCFIYDELKNHSLNPSQEADKQTLVRRVSLDLTGLPPSTSLSEKYLNNSISYDQLVDSLLASVSFGERWAGLWMDLARYADTKGYERDYSRSIWRYRDWLIRSFNQDKPYNQFLTEQIAGDLLPNATDDQLIATAYHRNTMTNDEGGTDNEEYRTMAVMDRISTTWDGLLGTTFGCVQCHSHPYDPFKHDEYYKFMAFFNNTRDEDTYYEYPLLRSYESEDSIKLLNIVSWLKANGYTNEADEANIFLRTFQPSYNSQNADSLINCAIDDTKWLSMRSPSTARLRKINLDQRDQLITRIIGFIEGGVLKINIDGTDGPLLKKVSVPKTKGYKIIKIDFSEQRGVHDLYLSYSNTSVKGAGDGINFDWLYFGKEIPGKDRPGYENIVRDYWSLIDKRVSSTPVMIENPSYMSRTTQVFERGNWMVKGEEVQPDVPKSLNPLPKGAPRNRLGLAMWLTDKSNPLTARTLVNRIWEQLFGVGIVETLEDMGTQGLEPTHRELLNYLSYKFMNEHQWSVKKLIKEIVSSATYKQDSKVSDELLEKDRFNKYYARGPRVRLSAEQIRDQALASCRLLSSKMYGQSVMPWQPEKIWMSPFNSQLWKKSEGEDQYRRAIYTYWKRSAPYPSMMTFDGVTREVCVARRIRTNTPLQALVTLNDSVYLEASRVMAYYTQKHNNTNNIRDKINYAYELILFKPLNPMKLDILEKLYDDALNKFEKDKLLACEMIGMDNEHNTPETAALVVVMNALLNLDEVVTKS